MNPFEVMKFAEQEELPRNAPNRGRAKRGANPQPKAKVVKLPEVPVPKERVAAPREGSWKVPAYQHSTAMREALERARAVQPGLISISSSPVRGNDE